MTTAPTTTPKPHRRWLRFSLRTLLIMVSAYSLFVWLNTRATVTESKPYYAPLMGALLHPPPYVLKEMGVTFHRDRGWPIWHSRATNHYAAHNAALYYSNDEVFRPKLSWETDFRRLAVDVG
ncbi:MAG: hypothetical protein NTY19_03940, partial [Planctomycetota bacterium]|nr:hypothetical protein [Planctomycetota bacterium]